MPIPLKKTLKLFLLFLGVSILFPASPFPAFSLKTAIPVTDSVSPPPGSPDTLSGPTEGCVGDTAVYSAELPVGCTVQWYIDSTLQSSDSGTLEVVWTDQGDYTVSLFDCDSGTIFSDSLQVAVYATPSIAGVIVGDANVCQNTQHTYSTTVQEGEWCAWYVAGELQSSTDTFMVYTFGNPGDYLIEILAVNDCGTGDQANILMVTAFEPPVVYLGNDTTIYEGQSITLDAGNTGSQYLWSTGDSTQTITVSETGTYSVLVTNACGEDSDTLSVDVIVDIEDFGTKQEPRIFIRGCWLIVEDDGFEIQQISVTDLSGKTVYKEPGDRQIHLSRGRIYILIMKTDKGILTRKIPVF